MFEGAKSYKKLEAKLSRLQYLNRHKSEPGAIFKVPSSELEALPEASYSLYDFRWDNALKVGRKIFREDFPKDVTVYLIEAEN